MRESPHAMFANACGSQPGGPEAEAAAATAPPTALRTCMSAYGKPILPMPYTTIDKPTVDMQSKRPGSAKRAISVTSSCLAGGRLCMDAPSLPNAQTRSCSERLSRDGTRVRRVAATASTRRCIPPPPPLPPSFTRL
ncbi:hypothetical protein Vafri_10648 [Volvox africanus]|uniref:Uncharacterized protein n=1 Tax=Volvox africanus TaxID=51714 RepID=A0A8J4F2H7_9CHLO|nr:hypothetical protein Vafri_10648 [Volvox africanus]